MRLLDAIRVWPQHILPQHGLSRLMYRLARSRFKPWKNLMIHSAIRLYRVDMREALKERAADYASFNDFFTRRLKPEARTWHLDEANIISPVDGAISRIGRLSGASLIQAKGRHYSLYQLLAGDEKAGARLEDGCYATLYLSPRDYHRVHMPASGRLIKSAYVPGRLFAVNKASARGVDNLFAANERFISLFETGAGLLAQIMVGAIFVGGLQTVWLGEITPAKKRRLTVRGYKDRGITLQQGQEFGHFNMGSTVILIFEKDKIAWLKNLNINDSVAVGQILGKARAMSANRRSPRQAATSALSGDAKSA